MKSSWLCLVQPTGYLLVQQPPSQEIIGNGDQSPYTLKCWVSITISCPAVQSIHFHWGRANLELHWLPGTATALVYQQATIHSLPSRQSFLPQTFINHLVRYVLLEYILTPSTISHYIRIQDPGASNRTNPMRQELGEPNTPPRPPTAQRHLGYAVIRILPRPCPAISSEDHRASRGSFGTCSDAPHRSSSIEDLNTSS